MKQEREAACEDGHSAGIEEGRAAEAKATAKALCNGDDNRKHR